MAKIPKNPGFEYRSIQYAISMQNYVFILLGFSLCCIFGVVFFSNPFNSILPLILFWSSLWIFLSCCITYVQFWWFFSYKGAVIYTYKVNAMLLRSSVLGGLIIYGATLWHMQSLNFTSVLILIFLSASYLTYYGKN